MGHLFGDARHSVNAFQLGWFPDYPDAEDYLVPFYGTKSDFLSNGYSNPKMDEFLAREQAAQTWAERLRFIQHAQLLAAQEVPIIPYWQGTRSLSRGITCREFRARWVLRSSCGSGCCRSPERSDRDGGAVGSLPLAGKVDSRSEPGEGAAAGACPGAAGLPST